LPIVPSNDEAQMTNYMTKVRPSLGYGTAGE
jgi:hypothetical protein